MSIMKCELEFGTYIIAVSGGVDSMVLLDVVSQLPGVELVVAHVNHGIREDAARDAALVHAIAMSHNLQYEETTLALGPLISEEDARRARYDFLRHIYKKYNAQAILTAHHKDDLIETAVINTIRGTGWRGLSSLRSTTELVRPFLDTPKAVLLDYAIKHNLAWRHDTTNDDTHYLRNYVRHEVLPNLPPDSKQKLYEYIVRQSKLTEAIDNETAEWRAQFLQMDSGMALLPRYQLIMMPEYVAHEILRSILRQSSGKSMTRPLTYRALLFAKVAKSNKVFPINAEWQLRSLSRKIIVERRPDVVS